LGSPKILDRRRVPILIISGVFFILSAVILMNLERPPGAPSSTGVAPGTPSPEAREAAKSDSSATPETAVLKPANPSASTPPPVVAAPAVVEEPPAAIPPPPAAPTPPPVTDAPTTAPVTPGSGAVGEADLIALKTKGLLIPVAGVPATKLRDSFDDGRSEGRQHQALDIMAPQGTPVLAVADGVVAKLFQSDKGGITLYQSDSSGLYFYYYAHLMSYADGITEGKQLKRGDVIGYVGDTGNAGAGNFHLHFAISKPASPGKWSGGAPINPYPLLLGK
jgi:peptidoglycan LD-endopeptidase LytH